MLKRKLISLFASSAIVGAALVTGLPGIGSAQQNQIVKPPAQAEGTQTEGTKTQGTEQTQGAQNEGTQTEGAKKIEGAENKGAESDATKKAEGTENEGAAKQTDRLAGANMFVPEQESGDMIAQDYIGQKVYNHKAEEIAKVNDLVFGEDGQVKAVILGVGGLLGIGQKDVAVRFDAIETSRKADTDEPMLVLDASADDLKAAPEFLTAEAKAAAEQAAASAQQQQQQQQQMQQQQSGAGAPKPLQQEQAPANN